MKKILFILGSLRENAFNAQLAKAAEKTLEGKAEVSYLDYRNIPLMNQDLETPVLPEVQAVRDQVMAADAIWIFSPAYNFSIPGPVKNLLDWLSRALDLSDTRGPSAIHDKVVTVSTMASAGHKELLDQYRFLLNFIRTRVVDEFVQTSPTQQAWMTGNIEVDEALEAALSKQAEALLAAIQ